MNSHEIEHNVKRIIENFSKDDFLYDLLSAYGISKTSITRLKSGDYNLSKVEGEILYKKKVFFKAEKSDKLLSSIESVTKDERILKHSPRFAILTDYKQLVAKDLKLGKNLDISIKDLPSHYAFFLPLAGSEVYHSTNDNEADRNAAYKMAQLYDLLITHNPNVYNSKESIHSLNIFLSRLLFCFFAEDTEIFEGDSIFTNTLYQHTNENGNDTNLFLDRLFDRLNSETAKGFPAHFTQFPYVNGGLFGGKKIASPVFTTKVRKILVELGELNWRDINPDIFGSMIQAVVIPEYRSDLGMHYTSVPNIQKLIKPLFLDALYEEFENCKTIPQLRKLINRIAKIKFFDPACGSGNFLIITYKEIRLLEIKILQRIIDLNPTPSMEFTSIQLSQFYGIELDDFAHEMAILSLWLAEHQMNRVFEEMLFDYGKSKPILPLKQAGQIVCDNAARRDWKSVCPIKKDEEVYIIGNPPYLGARVQDEEQKSDMAFVFSSLPKYKDLDYISIWFLKAKKYIQDFNAKFAFVSTNSICQGQQVALLWPNVLNNDIEICFAHLSFKWTNNAKGNAGVTVIILGLRNISTQPKYLFNGNIRKEAKNINAYLLDGANIVIAERMLPISKFPKMNFGNMPNDGGGLILTEEEKDKLLSENLKAKKFVRLLLGSAEYIRGDKRYCLWIEDEDLKESTQIPFIQKRIEITKKHRINSKDNGTNELAKRSHQFRDRNVAKVSQLIIPRVSSERRDYIPCGYPSNDIIASDSTLVIYDAEPYLFAVVNSKMHMIWVNAVGGKLKTDYRYSAKLCYNTFPFPEITLKQKENLNLYVFAILDERAKHPEKTMAQLYDPDKMPKGLRKAHEELDRAIEQCYRLQPFTSDTERLEYLFKKYEEMIKSGTLFEKQKKTRK
ncbi:MAG: class I SAM-dependent DNA methyltransferase [Sphingobacteriia bacterium]|nr:MAG: class I SAM-dependent DNA methyltransferase [Sphingobacteriia bacterium]TAH07256.1 MAG: class I SAM-dependent DNA methyltransferase [Sphingobacteriia bacterium]